MSPTISKAFNIAVEYWWQCLIFCSVVTLEEFFRSPKKWAKENKKKLQAGRRGFIWGVIVVSFLCILKASDSLLEDKDKANKILADKNTELKTRLHLKEEPILSFKNIPIVFDGMPITDNNGKAIPIYVKMERFYTKYDISVELWNNSENEINGPQLDLNVNDCRADATGLTQSYPHEENMGNVTYSPPPGIAAYTINSGMHPFLFLVRFACKEGETKEISGFVNLSSKGNRRVLKYPFILRKKQ